MNIAGDGLSIRHARPGDRDAILVTLSLAFAPFRPAYPEEAYRQTVLEEEMMTRRLQRMRVLVAERDGTVVGTVSWSKEGRDGHVRGMAVVPTEQGTGCARALLEVVEEEARVDGCRFITLETTQVLRRARGFYTKHGYRLTGVVRDYFGIEVEDLAKELS